jgi:hypothetical protein
VPSPNPGHFNSIEAVAAVSPHAAWAVGNWDRGGHERGLILRFDGTRWKTQQPAAVAGPIDLQAVGAVSASDAWIVGQRFVRTNPNGSGVEHTFTLHWNGSSWSTVPSPNVGGSDSSLHGVVAIAHDDVWAVGDWHVDLDRTRTLILHWDGHAWHVVPSPNPAPAENFLAGASAASANDIWAVGQRASDTSGLHGRTFAVHWNGSAWSAAPTPNAGTNNELFGVTVLGPSSAWAVGQKRGGGRTLAERWNGSHWSIVPTPNVGSGPNSLEGVAAVGPANVWAIGSVLTGGLGIQSQAVRWGGHAWHEVPVEQTGAYDTGLGAVARIPGTTGLWAAGYFSNTAGQPLRTLIERAC